MQWQEIVPATPFTAFTCGEFSPERADTMTILYQPLIGPVAYSLYMMLMTEVKRHPHGRITGTHKQWMTQTGQQLSMLFKERQKLEALGLLETYREGAEEPAMFYELMMPLQPKDFFQDELLSVYLYNRIGSKERYRELRRCFLREGVDTENLSKITKGFSEVFTSVHPSEMRSTSREMEDIINVSSNIQGVEKQAEYSLDQGIPLDEVTGHLPSFINREELYKPENKKLIQQIAFLYNFSYEELAHIIQESMLHTDYLDEKKIREAAKRKYRLQEGGKPPMLGMRTQPPGLRSAKGEPQSEEEAQIKYFETTSPVEYLHALSGGAKVFEGDIAIIEELMHDYNLPAGVVNVLIDYLYMVNNGKLAKQLAFKIAAQWKRKKISTVAQAMEIAKQEHEERRNFQTKKTKPAREKAEEPVPKWMKEQMEKENAPAEEAEPEDIQKAKQEAAKYRELLRRKKEKKG